MIDLDELESIVSRRPVMSPADGSYKCEMAALIRELRAAREVIRAASEFVDVAWDASNQRQYDQHEDFLVSRLAYYSEACK